MKKNLFEYVLANEPLERIDLSKYRLINTLNPHSYCVAERDSVFKSALLASDLLLPDGIGVVYAERLLNSNNIRRITGYDLFRIVMKCQNEKSGSVFFLGSTDATLRKMQARAKIDYPNVHIGFYSPPFASSFTKSETQDICDRINYFNPDVLFIGMTAPKQEKWAYQNQHILQSRLICSVGAVFDFYSGNIKRAPNWMMPLGLEWVYRSVRSVRLLKRNLTSNPRFVALILFKLMKSW